MDVTKHRFTVGEYHKMGEAGIFGEDDRVELIEGEIVEMTPVDWRHVQAVNELTHLLVERASQGSLRYTVSVQNPLIVDGHIEPQPDLVLLRERVRGRVPEAHDALLVVEVADSSLRYDREVKLPLYGRAGVPEYWLVDLSEGLVEAYSEPNPEGYAKVSQARGDEEVPSSVVKDVRVAQILA